MADFAKDEAQALELAKDNKVLDLVNTVERFSQLLLQSGPAFIWMLQIRLSSVVKSQNKRGLGFFNLSIGKDIQNHKQDDG